MTHKAVQICASGHSAGLHGIGHFPVLNDGRLKMSDETLQIGSRDLVDCNVTVGFKMVAHEAVGVLGLGFDIGCSRRPARGVDL